MYSSKLTLCLLSLLFSFELLSAQPVRFTARAGVGSIVEDSHIGFGAAVDIQSRALPLALSPFVESFRGAGLSRTYFGVNLLLTNSLAKSGLYAGGGIGSTTWNFSGSSRSAQVVDVLVGGRFYFSGIVGGFVEAKFLANSKTNSDTDIFNESSRNGFRNSIPDFLFDNDLVVKVGFIVRPGRK